jgi:PAS domain S-box-containing protein
MQRGSPVSVAVAGVLPLIPSATIVMAESLGEATSALLLLASVVAACLIGGAAGGVAATALAAFAFDLMVLPPRFVLVTTPGALLHLLVFTATAGSMVVVTAQFTRLDSARAEAERRNRALQEQMRLVAPLMDASPIGAAVFDTALRFSYVNRQLAQTNGRAVADHLGRTLSEVFPPEYAELTEPPLRDVLTTGRSQYNVDLTAEIDGVVKHFLVNRYPVRTPDNELLGVAVTVQDLTERQRLAALEAETARLRDTAELAHRLQAAQRIAGFGSWEIDLATGGMTWSTQMRAIVGLDTASAEVQDVDRFVHPDDIDDARRYAARLAQDGTAYTTEFRMVRTDGRIITVVASGEPVRDDTGRVAKLWGTVIDVTAQRAAETAARDAIRAAEITQAQLEAEHATLEMFQRAMLPTGVPTIPDVDLAVAYRPHPERAQIGGDWYDAFVLPDGRLALAIGDVTGHDLRAATIMGQVRNAVRAYAIQDPRPGSVLEHTNALLRTLSELNLTTMIYGVYDPATFTLLWSRAGHPPPLLRRGDAVTSLERPNGPLLGAVGADRRYSEGTLVLTAGDTLVWYTDGVIERRGGDIIAAEQQLQQLIMAHPVGADAHSVVTAINNSVIADGVLDDDACLLVLHVPATAACPTGHHSAMAARPTVAEPGT